MTTRVMNGKEVFVMCENTGVTKSGGDRLAVQVWKS